MYTESGNFCIDTLRYMDRKAARRERREDWQRRALRRKEIEDGSAVRKATVQNVPLRRWSYAIERSRFFRK